MRPNWRARRRKQLIIRLLFWCLILASGLTTIRAADAKEKEAARISVEATNIEELTHLENALNKVSKETKAKCEGYTLILLPDMAPRPYEIYPARKTVAIKWKETKLLEEALLEALMQKEGGAHA